MEATCWERIHKTRLAGNGLRMIFARDLSQKYARYFRHAREFDESKLIGSNEWCAVGYYDFIRVEAFGGLKELEDVRDGAWQTAWRSFKDLVLVPFEDDLPDDSFKFRLCHPERSELHENPLMVVINLSLSPAMFEIDDTPEKVLQTIRNATLHLRASLERADPQPPTHYFASLSGPDLVVVAMPRDASELWATQRLVRRARTLTLAELKNGLQFECLDEDQKQLRKMESPCHACVAVEPILAFRMAAIENFRCPTFQETERKAGLKLTFRLQLDCGHEDEVLQSIANNCPSVVFVEPQEARMGGTDQSSRGGSPEQWRTSWGTYSVEGYFEHLYDFAKVCRTLWFEERMPSQEGLPSQETWRERNLLHSITSLSLYDIDKVSTDVHTEWVWTLSDGVRSDLESICKSLETFSEAFLSEPQQAELMGIYHSFRACFFRHRLLGTARDLLPFFKQLSGAMSLVQDDWKDYFTHPRSDEIGLKRWSEFSIDVGRLLAHAQRAVRNRIEHRSLQGDPPVQHTLEHGGCKLVDAYSAAFSLVAELFWLKPDQIVVAPGDMQHFAALIRAGSSGKVECEELFRGFRKFVEERHGGPLAKHPREGWSSPLLLLDISGRSLLRPELGFAYCAHEMAELSAWIMLKRCDHLRVILNEWVFREVALAFNDALAVTACNVIGLGTKPEDLAQAQRNLSAFSSRFTGCCAAAFLANPRPVDADDKEPDYFGELADKGIVKARLGDICRKWHPIDFAFDLADAVQQGAIEFCKAAACLQKVFPNTEIAIDKTTCLLIFNDNRLKDAISVAKEFITEVLADIGMFCAIQHILDSKGMRSREEKFRDLNKVFSGLLIAVAESNGHERSHQRLDQMIVYRWAIQAAALMYEEPWQDGIVEKMREVGKRYEAENTPDKPNGIASPADVKNYLQEIENYSILFDSPFGLAVRLNQLTPYGGDQAGPQFPPESNFTPAEQELFESFRRAWETGHNPDRMNLIFRLWAVSGKLAVPHVLECTRISTNETSSLSPRDAC